MHAMAFSMFLNRMNGIQTKQNQKKKKIQMKYRVYVSY